MKSFFLIFLGLIGVLLSAFYIFDPAEFQISNYPQVFAQSEGNNKNFEDAKTSHSSETSITLNTKENNSMAKIFGESILSPSSDTSTITKQNKEKKSYIGRPLGGESTKIHPAITKIFEHADPRALAKIYGATLDKDKLFVYVHFSDSKLKNKPTDIEILAQDKNIIVSKLSLSQIHSLADLDSVKRITLPDYAVFETHESSEGVIHSMADTMQDAGFVGAGINVAVIDDSFFVTNPEISSRISISRLFDSENKCEGDISCGKAPNAFHIYYDFSSC